MTPIFSLPVLFQDNTVLLLFCTVPTNWEILWLFPVLINPFNIFSEYILSHTLLMKLRAQKQNLICFARFKLNSSGTPVPQSLRGLPHCSARKEPTCQCRRGKRQGFHPWVGKIPLEREMATHSSILAWEILWTQELGGLQSMGLQSQTRMSMH